MAADRWQLLWRLFHRALELAPEKREALILRTEQDDPALAEELRGLLAGHEQQHSALDHPVLGAPALQAGERLGAWRLIRELGAGGMGVVWLAERADGAYEQLAALKILSPAYAAPGLVRHFLRERQILARLKHPHIAALLDGGATPGGCPYLVMEFVQGVALDRYCREYAPDLDTQLRLFCRICEAVDYAHRHLVIHRDLKPANVLITADGEPKLLDFGIAKLLEDDPDAPLTLPAERRLTPDYASPELLRGEAVGTAADCYALGVMLYELLAGERPWRLQGFTSERALAVIERHEPPTVSRTAAKGGAAPERVRALRGDLDNVVRKALAADPQARYSSAKALADDLQRHLRGEPVQARTPTWRYRAGKFIGRHRLGVAATAAAGLALIAFTVALGWGAFRLNKALQESQLQTQRAEALSGFLTDLFLAADPERHAGEPLTVQTLLAQGTERLSAGFNDQPKLKADLLTTLGRIHTHLGDFTRAEALLTDALALREARRDPDRTGAAHTAAALAMAHIRAGRYAEAEALARRALAIFHEQLGTNHPDTRHARLVLATALQFRGKLPEAENALQLALQGPPLNDPMAIEGWLRLGSVAWGKGEFKQAEAHYRDALDAAQDLYGAQSAQAARAMNAVAAALYRQGRYPQAESLYEKTLVLRREIYGDGHPYVAETLGNLGALAYDQGDYAASIARLEKTLALLTQIHGPNSLQLGVPHNNLALSLMATGQYAKAEQHYREALRLNRTNLGEAHPDVGSSLANLGLLYLEQQRYPEAEQALIQALTIQRAHYKKPHFATAYTLNHLGRLHLNTKRLDSARQYFNEALAMRLDVLDADHPSVADTRLWLGRLELASGNASDAAGQFQQALAIRQTALEVDDWRIHEAAGFLGAARLTTGPNDAAQKLYDTSLARMSALRGPKDHHVLALRAAVQDEPIAVSARKP